MTDALAAGAAIRGCNDPPAYGPAVVAVLICEYEEADNARRRAELRYATAQSALGRALVATGPRIDGIHRYVGLSAPGLRATVVRTQACGCGCDVEAAPVVAGHAAICITEDDGEID